jgi:hypothetical protein
MGFISKHNLFPIIIGPGPVFYGPLQSSFHNFSCKELLFFISFLAVLPTSRSLCRTVDKPITTTPTANARKSFLVLSGQITFF